MAHIYTTLKFVRIGTLLEFQVKGRSKQIEGIIRKYEHEETHYQIKSFYHCEIKGIEGEEDRIALVDGELFMEL
jgi:hypothetical protein